MARKRKAEYKWRSKFEEGLGARLVRERVRFSYETLTYDINLQVVGAKCQKCFSKDIGKRSKYTPDFFFGDIEDGVALGWVIEAKGKFTARDRKRVLALIAAYPDMRFGMLFQRDNKLSKSSKTRYSTWCEERGIPWAVGWFKEEWME